MNLEQAREAILRAPLWVKIILGWVVLLVFLITLPITIFVFVGYLVTQITWAPNFNPESEDDEP